ncbi:hypothetical protein [Rosettibacter firmus]|uniref:hypothetical protein n=1 Tax=Rosettibacter firmus TaxID=3111522 RepID=UPI00336C08EE
MYLINGIEYRLKQKYTLKDWGKILEIINSANAKDEQSIIINLLAEDKVTDLLNIILDTSQNKINELYEDDFEEINRIIKDFFSRKTSLIKNTISSSNI